ncbi:hypothetical protein C0992_012873 [Termitomyces sp. T32_za158]|nr:hypothetical protein C0992_012873 [Termitomyces sp. T32_za158]
MSVTSIPVSHRFAEALSLLKSYPRFIPNRRDPHSFQRQLNDSTLWFDADDFEQDKEILHLLDAAAVCLSTTENGGSIAVGIEGSVKDTGTITLVLAKNRNSNLHDRKMADEFIRTLKSSVNFQQALKFVVIHGRESLNERIRTLRQTFFQELLSSIASHSFQESVGEEFRSRFTVLVLNDRKWSNKPVRGILEYLLGFIRSIQELDDDIEASHARFVNLVLYSLMLKSSRYMSFLIESSTSTEADWYPQLKAFWRALHQIAYFQKIEKLVKIVHDRNVKVRWAKEISYTRTGGADPVPCRPLSVLTKQLFIKYLSPGLDVRSPLPFNNEDEESFYAEMERLVKQEAPPGHWDSDIQAALSLHPEIRIVLDPAMALAPHHLIGCSSHGCLCCLLWLDAYSHLEPSVPRWYLSRFRPNIDIGWALPGETTGVAGILPLDQVVLENIEKELFFRQYEYIDTYL